jgi:hypothetical protein
MTREELFYAFPRPVRFSDDHYCGLVDANGGTLLIIDPEGNRDEDDVIALAELLVEPINGAEE